MESGDLVKRSTTLRCISSAAWTAPSNLTLATVGFGYCSAKAPLGFRYDLIKWRHA